MIITGLIIIAASLGGMYWYATADLFPEYNDKPKDDVE